MERQRNVERQIERENRQQNQQNQDTVHVNISFYVKSLLLSSTICYYLCFNGYSLIKEIFTFKENYYLLLRKIIS